MASRKHTLPILPRAAMEASGDSEISAGTSGRTTHIMSYEDARKVAEKQHELEKMTTSQRNKATKGIGFKLSPSKPPKPPKAEKKKPTKVTKGGISKRSAPRKQGVKKKVKIIEGVEDTSELSSLQHIEPLSKTLVISVPVIPAKPSFMERNSPVTEQAISSSVEDVMNDAGDAEDDEDISDIIYEAFLTESP